MMSGPTCPSCGVTYGDHLGLHGPCAALLDALRERDEAQAMMLEAIARQKRAEADCDEARAALRHLTHDWTPVDDARCPDCGATVKWSCGIDAYPWGSANCEQGSMVSRRVNPALPLCEWRGALTVRVGDAVLMRPSKPAIDPLIAARDLLAQIPPDAEGAVYRVAKIRAPVVRSEIVLDDEDSTCDRCGKPLPPSSEDPASGIILCPGGCDAR